MDILKDNLIEENYYLTGIGYLFLYKSIKLQ